MTKQGLEKLIVNPAVWPRKNLQVQPGNLSKFAPYGNGFYGYQENSLEPIRGDPPQEKSGGLIYFNNNVKKEDFSGFLRMIDVKSDRKDYAAFIQESSNPVKDRYFKQMRLISKFGLRFMFEAIDAEEHDSFKEQDLTIKEALWEFMESEKERFGTCFGDSRIEGKMGGDGNYAREQLSFGFMLENEPNEVYRIWSRAWLVTK
ncbi:hypothetical protein COV11_00280 [Candidatus Woesearchaeota archaeon CG10_big_fil_rev_8_21_14_0_10_30_7]|nr:MAG: hypothetical protein COV11_00280 [Candidatus Woesearchaeota archaeon CG10_big_fil_rev_8_21_14_0_10_30_7]